MLEFHIFIIVTRQRPLIIINNVMLILLNQTYFFSKLENNQFDQLIFVLCKCWQNIAANANKKFQANT